MHWFYALPIVMLPNALHLPADMGVGLSLVLLAGAGIFGPREPRPLQSGSWLLPPLTGLFLALMVGYVLALRHDASDPGGDLVRAKYAVIYPLLYLAYRHCGMDLAATRRLIMLVVVVAVLAGLEAVIQGLQFDLGEFAGDQRATGPFGEITAANRAGVFFAMFLPLAVALALRRDGRRPVRLFALAGSVVLVAAILFTFSRQSYVIAAFAILLILFHRGVPAALLACLLFAGAGAALMPESAVQRIEETRQVGAGGTASMDDSTASRLDIWKGAAAMLAANPLGVGLGQFDDHIGEYSNFPGMDAHNGFVLMLAECGPFGLAMMLWLFWRLLVLASRLRRVAHAGLPEDRALALGMTVAVLCVAASNLYGSPFFAALVMNSFWILCGLMERHGLLLAQAATSRLGPAAKPVASPAARFPLAARAMPGLVARQRQRAGG